MDRERLRQLVTAFSEEMQTSDDLHAHQAQHQQRSQRAQALLTSERIPSLSEDELQELFFDTDAFSFWSNKEWEFNNRLQNVGLDGLRNALLELITRAERGLTPDDLKQVWDMRGLGTLLSTELLAYRFPTRYWTYSSNVTLPALQRLGDDVKAGMPRGQKSDPYLYLAMEPRMAQVRQALLDAGLADADNLAADIFLWWVKTMPGGIPDVNAVTIEKALRDFDAHKRAQPEWADWESDQRHQYAISWQGRRYPVKEIVRMATGAIEFTSAQARPYLQKRDFQIVPLRPESASVWLFQANPHRYDLERGLRKERLTDWQVTRYRGEIRNGDRAIFWKASENRGIYGLGTVVSELYRRPDGDRVVDIQYEGRLRQPILYETLREHPVLAQMLIMRQPQGTNFRVTRDEWAVLEPILGEIIPPDPDAMDARQISQPNGRLPLLSLLRRSLTRRGLCFTPWQIATFYTALQTKGFVILSGISGTGKTKLAQHFAELLYRSPRKPVSSLFVPVRPDWRDSKSLLGYYNPLTSTYAWTPFLRFLLHAAQSYRAGDGLAWFVILDEMNLAHVEYYFADLLSGLESGRDEEGWTREPLRLGYPDEAEGDLPPHELCLPPNLYVIGTVNVDETTHAFSPKVLDRAFTLELTEADFSDYPFQPDEDQDDLSPHERQALLENFAFRGAFVRVDKQTIANYLDDRPEVRTRLQILNDRLRPYELHFGYRVFDEIVSFLATASHNGLYDDLGGVEAAFDAAVLMKVLPKFHGSRGKLEAPLRAVLAWCVDPDAPAEEAITDALKELEGGGDVAETLAQLTYRYPKTAERARRMFWALYTTGFAAFG